MKLTVNTCYSRLLYVMCSGGEKFKAAISSMEITKGPYFEHEGLAGYIETEVVFGIKDIVEFAKLWDRWHSLNDERRSIIYNMAKNGMEACG